MKLLHKILFYIVFHGLFLFKDIYCKTNEHINNDEYYPKITDNSYFINKVNKRIVAKNKEEILKNYKKLKGAYLNTENKISQTIDEHLYDLGLYDRRRREDGFLPFLESVNKKIAKTHDDIKSNLKKITDITLSKWGNALYSITDNIINYFNIIYDEVGQATTDTRRFLGISSISEIPIDIFKWTMHKIRIILNGTGDSINALESDITKASSEILKQTLNITLRWANMLLGPEALEYHFREIKRNFKGLIQTSKSANDLTNHQIDNVGGLIYKTFKMPIDFVRDFILFPYTIISRKTSEFENAFVQTFEDYRKKYSSNLDKVNSTVYSINKFEKNALSRLRYDASNSIDNLKKTAFKKLEYFHPSKHNESIAKISQYFADSHQDIIKMEKIKNEALKKYPNAIKAFDFLNEIKDVPKLFDDVHRIEKTYKDTGSYWDSLVSKLKNKLYVLKEVPVNKSENQDYSTVVTALYKDKIE